MLRPSRRAARTALVLGFVIHAVIALLVWWTWGTFGRGNVLAWIDLPISLAFLHLDGTPFLFWSLFAGGLQWAAIAALLSLWLGRSVRGNGVAD